MVSPRPVCPLGRVAEDFVGVHAHQQLVLLHGSAVAKVREDAGRLVDGGVVRDVRTYDAVFLLVSHKYN